MTFPLRVWLFLSPAVALLSATGMPLSGAAEPGSGNRAVQLGNARFRVTVVVQADGLHGRFGPRFDRTAFVRDVRLGGEDYLSPEGLTDEFGISGKGVLAYDEAKPGQPFLKIGVGRLLREDEKPYRFFRPYRVSAWAPVTIESASSTLTASTSDTLGDFGYRYVKQYRVDAEKSTLVIAYELGNTGERAFRFDQYNHNWFRMGDEPIGQAYRLDLGFPVELKSAEWYALADSSISIARPVTKGVYLPSACAATAEQNWLRVHCDPTGQSVLVKGDFPLARFALFADQRGLCPEAFIESTVQPGRSVRWTRTYEFRPQAR